MAPLTSTVRRMAKHRKTLLWIGALLFLPAAAYSIFAAVYYAWLDGLSQSPTNAAFWSYGILAVAVLLVALFVVCVVALIKEHRTFPEERRASSA